MRILSNLTFTWNESTTPEQVTQIAALLEQLSRLPGIARLDHGPSLGLSPISRDYGVSVLFEDEAAFRNYLGNPTHQRFAQLGNSMAAETAIVQIPATK